MYERLSNKCVCVCIYIYIYIYTHTHTHTHTHTCVCVCVYSKNLYLVGGITRCINLKFQDTVIKLTVVLVVLHNKFR